MIVAIINNNIVVKHGEIKLIEVNKENTITNLDELLKHNVNNKVKTFFFEMQIIVVPRTREEMAAKSGKSIKQSESVKINKTINW